MNKMATDTKMQAKVEDLKVETDVKGGVSGTRLSDKDGNTGAGLVVR